MTDYRVLFEAAPGCNLVLAPDLSIVSASDEYVRVTMIERATLIGRGLFEVFAEDPSDAECTALTHLSASLRRVLAEKRRDLLEARPYPIRRPISQGGRHEERYWSALNQPVSSADGAVAYILHHIEDVTDVVRAKRPALEPDSAASAASAAPPRRPGHWPTSAVESLQHALALFDTDDRLVMCNAAYHHLMSECLPGPLVGMACERILDAWLDALDLPDEDSRARFRQQRWSRRRDAPAFEVRSRDGRTLRVMDRCTPDGGIVETIWDLTEDERAAEELRRARAAAEAASAAKSEFLASMSHELRTPLNAILGFAQLLDRDRREPLSERHRERVKQILIGGEHLLRLIDEVLNLARIEAGRVSLAPEPVNVGHVLDEVLQTLGPMAAPHDVELLLDPPSEGLPLAWADRPRFAQILLNLVSNAIKYNRPGGRVRLEVHRSTPKTLRILVRDTGMGIPFEKQRLLFQPFQRAGQETGPIEGTGIGLVITRRLARLMGGDVGFSSDPGFGSVFWVDIPVDESSREAPLPVGHVTPSSDASRVQPMVVLYVEDNAANVAFMEDLLGTLPDTELLTVSSAEQGMRLALCRRPDVIVMDINLPGMNGVEALHALRAEPATSAIPVIALTALASERDRQSGMDAGFHTYLTKPVNVEALIDVLASLPAVRAPAPSASVR